MRVLAVDDDPIILELIQAIFSRAMSPNAWVTVSSSGLEALKILTTSKLRFDCLLLDIDMPQMDGITLCHEVRVLEGYEHAPILMLTQRSDVVSIERAFAAGATDYVTKPFEVKNLLSRLRVASRMRQKTDEAPSLPLEVMSKKGLPGSHKFDLQDPVHIEGIQQLILPFPLGNYLSQLSRTELDRCDVFAAKIENWESLYVNGSTPEIAITIAAAVAAISKVIGRPNLLMSHNGGGVLICVVTGGNLPSWPEMEGLVQEELDRTELKYDYGGRMQIALSIGNPIRPNASSTQRVKRTFDRAIRRMVMRQKVKLNTSAPDALPVSAAH